MLVFIHEGGFEQGSGAVDIYNGEGLASKGLVVVTINYRLGVFGFLALPALANESLHHSAGNYGLLDQMFAWNARTWGNCNPRQAKARSISTTGITYPPAARSQPPSAPSTLRRSSTRRIISAPGDFPGSRWTVIWLQSCRRIG